MKSKKWNYIVYPHAVLLVWALLFFVGLLIPDGGEIASVLAAGNFLFLFVNIPLAVFSLVLKVKGYFWKEYSAPVVVLSILNIVIGIAAWLCIVLLSQAL